MIPVAARTLAVEDSKPRASGDDPEHTIMATVTAA